MSKTLTCLSAIATAALLALPMKGTAQVASQFSRATAATMQKAQSAKAVNPLLAKRMMYQQTQRRNSPFASANKGPVRKMKAQRRNGHTTLTAGNTVLWGNWIYDPLNANLDAGWYSFNPTFENTEMLMSFREVGALDGGSAIVDGVLYGISSWSFFNLMFFDRVSIDTNTWELISVESGDIPDYAQETATDPNTGLVYGEFFNEEVNGFMLSLMDYTTWTRTDIAPLEHSYVAMGISNKSELFGVDADANLYKISLTTGEETLIGATGLNFKDADGKVYLMSGDIDPTDNTFYINGMDRMTDDTGLYTVDLETGAATRVGYDVGEVAGLMLAPGSGIDANAPAKAQELSVVMDGATTSGVVSFTIPTATQGGGELSGAVSYQVLENLQVVAEGTSAAGETVSAPFTANAEGQQFLSVVLSNAAGKSAPATVGAWVGIDVPGAATDVEAVIENGNATVTWTAPEAGVHGGFQGDMSFNVYRIVGDEKPVKVAEGLKECTYSEAIPEGGLNYYCYAVEGQNEKYTGATVTSTGVVYGNAFEIPYVAPMTSASSKLFTIIDANDDGSTWSFDTSYNLFKSRWHSTNVADDWLITPPIRLEAGKSYAFTTIAKNGSNLWGPERMEVKMGTAATAEAMTTTIVEPTDLTNTEEEYGNEIIRVEETGEYYFGIHAISEADMYTIEVSYIAVEAGLEPTSPLAVENLTVTPDAQGEAKATVSFVAPTKNVSDENIEGDVKAQVLRDKVVVGEVTAAPGAEASFVDAEGLTNGIHVYQVIPFVGENRGVKSKTVTAFIGFDVPAPVDVTETLNPAANKVSMKWTEATEGVNGGLVLPEKTYYKVYSTIYNEDAQRLELVDQIDSVYAETSTEFAYATETGENILDYWFVFPGNAGGEDQNGAAGSMYVGKPFTLPFVESFTGNTLAGPLTYFFSDNTNSNNSGMYFSKESSDNDGASVMMQTIDANSWIRMAYGKFSAANGAVNPVVIFDYQTDNDANNAYVVVDLQNGKKDVFDMPKGKGWQTGKVSLKNYANERYVVPYIGGNFVEPGSMLIDNIMIFDMLEYDLVASVEAPKAVEAGQTAKVTVKVRNLGENAAKGYTVHVYAGDEELALDGAEFNEIKSLETAVFTANFREDIFSDAKNVTLKAVVDYNVDLDPDNNVAETSVKVNTASLNGPENVAAAAKDNGVHVSWTVPENTVSEVTESFEDQEVFKPFSTGGITADNHYGSFGNWSLYDATGSQTYSWSGVSYDGAFAPMAFEVINPAQISAQLAESYGAATGEQYLMSFCVSGGTPVMATDHWLISPELPGGEQTISFSVRELTTQYGAETFEVLASKGGVAPSEFTLVKALSTTSTEYETVEVTLPAGTTHFAIRHTSRDIFGLMLDDVKFTTSGGVDLKGYKVYVDRVLVAGLPADVRGYVYPEYLTNGTHEFSVSGVLANGKETKPVSVTATVNNAPTAIESIVAKGEPFDVYTVDGVAVRRNVTNVEGLKAGVYVINNQKVVIK